MKAVIFDFDGTLTKGFDVWKATWKTLTYDVGKNSFSVSSYVDFLNKKITYEELNQLNLEKFIEMDMNISDLHFIAKKIRLIDGFSDTIKALYNKGFSIHIVSGGILNVIEKVIGEDIKYFTSINANKMHFGDGYFLDRITRTKYDFEGKALFIKELIRKTGIKSENITFVGNSSNDEWAYKTGCKTICVNPENTCADNKRIWNEVIYNMTDLRQILPLISNLNIEKREAFKNNYVQKMQEC